MWPWMRYRRAVESAAVEAQTAVLERRAAEQRRDDAQRQAARSKAISADLRREIDRNGWTELLQKAWGAR